MAAAFRALALMQLLPRLLLASSAPDAACDADETAEEAALLQSSSRNSAASSTGGSCSGPTQGLDWSQNSNIPPMGNNNIKNSASECKQQCEQTSGCNAFTWKTDSKQCWLKSSVSGQKYVSISQSGTCSTGPTLLQSSSRNSTSRPAMCSSFPYVNNNCGNGKFGCFPDEKNCLGSDPKNPQAGPGVTGCYEKTGCRYCNKPGHTDEQVNCPNAPVAALQTAAAQGSVCSPKGGQSDCDNGGTNHNLPSSPGASYHGDVNGCESLCSTTSGCAAWTFLENNQGTGTKQCWLKSSSAVAPGQPCSGQQYNHATSGWCN